MQEKRTSSMEKRFLLPGILSTRQDITIIKKVGYKLIYNLIKSNELYLIL